MKSLRATITFNYSVTTIHLNFTKLKTRSIFKLRLISLIIVLFGSLYGSATHLVGGYITYEHLGNNLYRIDLKIYRDCNPGTASLSNPVTVKIEDLSTNLSQILTLFYSGPIPHSLDTSKCIIVPPGVCIEYYEFSDTITLPPTSGGYSLSLGMCCRNGLIMNIPGPVNTTYAWNTNIPPNDTAGNSSPEFLTPPPVLLCYNEPLKDTLHARDVDRDSLYYELCDIYSSSAGNISPVLYNPPFSSSYPIPSSPSFSINPVSGQLTGTPNQIGHYVVGICVTDYRNGIPLSTVRLDYEFNVTTCYTITSDILTQAEDSTLFCKGLNLNFTAESPNATSFFWDFGDTTTLGDTSNLKNPSYNYAQPGFYNVMLIVEPGDKCSDTSFAIFEVHDPLSPSFSGTGTYCFADQPIQFANNASYPAGATYKWDFGPWADIPVSSMQNPPMVSFSKGGKHPIKLTVKFGKCSYDYEDTVVIGEELISDFVVPSEDPSMNCQGLKIRFVSESKGEDTLMWNFGDLSTLSDTSNADTVFYTFPKQGFYMVSLVVTQVGGCKDSTSHMIEVFPEIDPQIQMDGQFCFEAQDIDFEAIGSYPTGTDFQWQFGSLASKKLVNNPSAPNMSWQQPGTYIVSLTASKSNCNTTVYDTVNIPAWSVSVDAGPDQTINYRDLVELYGSAASQHYWYSDRPMSITNPFGRHTTVDIPTAGDSVKIYLKVTDANGCQGLDSLSVYVIADDRDRAFNTITPNGDGLNDFLDLGAFMNGDVCEFTVLNRWGSEVYHAEKYQNDWPGVDYRGRLLPDGTYYYILFCDRQVTAKGPITIIRNNTR